MLWLTDERCLALFPAGTIVRDPHHLESPTRREQDLNLQGVCMYICMYVCSRVPGSPEDPGTPKGSGGPGTGSYFSTTPKFFIFTFYIAHW